MPRVAPRKALEVLADPTRSEIFEILGSGPKSVGEVARKLPVSRPAVSYHLAILQEAGLVVVHREGTRHIHAIDPQGLGELRAWFAGFWSASLDDLKEHVEGETSR
jgi:DNA-binding transcriptional ArsR family regulator